VNKNNETRAASESRAVPSNLSTQLQIRVFFYYSTTRTEYLI